MRFKSLAIRILFCLPFVLIVFYIYRYHGEWINNAQVEWQYVKDSMGETYLAIDVYSPSGIKISGIYMNNSNITAQWQLINYPNWYKGKENFKTLNEFQNALHPYLPYNNDVSILYTTGWYTYLYKWLPVQPTSLPSEDSIRIKYQNPGTQNYYNAKHVLGIKIISNIIGRNQDRLRFDIQFLYPISALYKYSYSHRPKIVLDNLIASSDSEYVLRDFNRRDYGVYILDTDGYIIDSLRATVKYDSKDMNQVYSKTHYASISKSKIIDIDFTELLNHIIMLIFMIYFVLICWQLGAMFVMWRGIVLERNAAKVIMGIFLGIILLTYIFFIIGILQLLNLPTLFIILLLILYFGFNPKIYSLNIGEILTGQLRKIKNNPSRIIFLIILTFALLYNFSYCFIPATYPDGGGDITSSYLPNLNDYVISCSFKAPIYNSTSGLNSQTIDVLRTVVKIFIGEPGVYMLSFIYLLLIIGSIYLIGKDFFGVTNLLVYISIILVLSGNLFTEAIHFGRWHIAALSFLLISLYSMRFSEHDKNYILPVLFFSFLVSSYIQFLIIALVYYLFVILTSLYKYKTIKHQVFKLYAKSLLLFCFLWPIPHLKLITEVGTCFPTGIIPERLRDFFLNLNQNNQMYKYIDNNYIRHFYKYHRLANIAEYTGSVLNSLILIVKTFFKTLDFAFIFLLLPLLKRLNRYTLLYISETIVLAFIILFIHLYGYRFRVFYIFPLFILQLAIVNDSILTLRLVKARIFKTNKFLSLEHVFILLILSLVFFDGFPKTFKIRPLKSIDYMWLRTDYRGLPHNQKGWFFREIFPVFLTKKSKYEYLKNGDDHFNFDHAMLIRQYADISDTILIVPVRFHSHAMRHITARHALGSVIYQKDIKKIMNDLKKLNINYLSYIPMHYPDYNPFYTPVFEDVNFYKYFKLIFSDNGRIFYKIMHDGSNTEYTASPYNIKGLPFVSM